MFKSCCARPTKKVNKSKSTSEKMDMVNKSDPQGDDDKVMNTKVIETDCNSEDISVTEAESAPVRDEPTSNNKVLESKLSEENSQHAGTSADNELNKDKKEDDASKLADDEEDDTFKNILDKTDLSKKRFSVDFKRPRLDFKRYSVDFRQDSTTLEELERLESELSRTIISVRPGLRRKSSGILKSTTSSNGYDQQRVLNKEESCSEDDDDVFERRVLGEEGGEGPPATPVGRDELAMRRHRFFSDLVCAARAAVEHRVRFDPLGPVVADTGETTLLT